MESDDSVSDNLRRQFRALQEQQQRRLQKLMERKKQEQRKSDTFGVQDQLHLLQIDRNASGDLSQRLLEGENGQLQGQLAELQDENGRLHKLLKEKEFEIRRLRKKIEDDKVALAGTAGLAGDVAATKIVELSKKNRELSAELESERTRVKQLKNKVTEMEIELQNTAIKLPQSFERDFRNGLNVTRSVDISAAESSEAKILQGKLAAANLKLTEYRNQIQSTKQELRVAHKVLANEVGEDVNISQLVSTPGSWRGRAQQILALQGRVRELESRLRSPASELGLEEETSAIPSRRPAQEKNLSRLRSLEKGRKETVERLIEEHDALKKEDEELKKKFEASKARNQSLSSDLKANRLQITMLLDKGKHDNELIDALLSQQKNMQEVLTRLSQQEQNHKDSQQCLSLHLNNQSQTQNSLVTQLKQMVAEREAKVRELEEEIQQLTTKTPPRIDSGTAEWREEGAEGPRADRWMAEQSLADSGDHAATVGSARTTSKLGQEPVEIGTAPFSSVSITASPASPELRALQTQKAELRALLQAAEVERDRLMELASVLHRRVEESNMKALEAEKRRQEERRRSVHLEQQLEKMRMETGKNGTNLNLPARGKAGQSLSSSRLFLNVHDISDLPSNVPLEAQLEELRTKLEIKMDENEALKMALKSALKTKEDDLKLYNQMMGQVKQIFLHALRMHKQERGAP